MLKYKLPTRRRPAGSADLPTVWGGKTLDCNSPPGGALRAAPTSPLRGEARPPIT